MSCCRKSEEEEEEKNAKAVSEVLSSVQSKWANKKEKERDSSERKRERERERKKERERVKRQQPSAVFAFYLRNLIDNQAGREKRKEASERRNRVSERV